ncbi:maltooligosyl trehalose synthase [Actinokineospora alba]|uniref:Maltooligosyl trehalose synthase n=1 Tax=Actinokineospora alba TaxID=504798 RepID=A0A1H0EXN2_9PSEU|nr:malto-oligosyltrehalose synthase [Actinokineospora alba]TDP69264.1 maltooligosyl trehalose synthase [Actinokineospora alba]SDI20707.1 (1->4)-alpha-D-glucan 1-alpha-D-glucosylmutase [Actinokineospora alba]SDN87132.1 maltooligosyl trehalose synthase [Actinokineospora alba]
MIPTSTYRVQVRPGFDLDATAELVPYLERLGVGAVYTSPLLAAAPGSTHGYDVVDPTMANPELGGEAARLRLVAAARAAGLGIVLDLVPNHMSVEVPSANPWWWDVLENGPESRYATWFDIDFAAGPILLPVLGDDPVLELRDGRLAYHEHEFPIAPGTAAGSVAEVHERQHYRLVDWRRGNAELTYRRFFDVTSLAAVRVELPEVFDGTHAEVLRWVAAGEVDGLRIDHPDGLADPGGYLRTLRERTDCWLVVEKILAAGESLPVSWPVHGTTGYDTLREVCGVFVDAAGEEPLTELAAKFGGIDFHAEEERCRRLITSRSLVAEMRRIAALAPGVPAEAVAELMVAFPVYRSYLPEGSGHWTAAVERARAVRPDLASAIDVLDRTVRADPDGELATRIQQTSGMVVAKGDEDTAFYRYPRLTGLNEVGGAPDRFGVSVAEFHAGAAAREAGWPAGMTALSTHDTKRSEDVRARLAVLAELAGEFAEVVHRWSARCGLPEPTLELLAWQSLVGAWPIAPQRLSAYLDKAAKEAKVRTSWVEHDDEFEAAVRAWPAAVAAELGSEAAEFVERIRLPGWSNALGQKLVQLAGPGVPDVYQGTELFDLSLVDPDNRRPVDFAERTRLLDRLESGWLPPVDDTGAAKLHVVRTVLRLRRSRPELFSGYRPLYADGPAATHALAFTRRPDLVAVATRLPVTLAREGGWRDTVLALPAGTGRWTDLLTAREVPDSVAPLGDLLSTYPVALLHREDLR